MLIGELKLLLGSRTCVRLDDQTQKQYDSIAEIPDSLNELVVWSLTAENDTVVLHVREHNSTAMLQLHEFEFDQGM